MFSVACSAGFASCKTFGKQPKHPCFGRSPKQGEGGSPTFSPFPRGRGFRQGCRNKDTPRFKHGCLQVVEQSRCRTHRQQTTTVAQMQSHQSVLKGIGIINQKFISKTDFFYNLTAGRIARWFCVYHTLFRPLTICHFYHFSKM